VENPTNGTISLKIFVPKGSISTYAGEDASKYENRIETLYIDLYEKGNATPFKQDTFPRAKLQVMPGMNDSIVTVGYEVDNIETGKILAKVYANRKEVEVITNEILIPSDTEPFSFFMSGQDSIRNNGTSYEGTIHLVRDVAKVRVNISMHSIVLPSDLIIDYDNVKIQVLKVPNQTSLFPGINAAAAQGGFNYIDYLERGGSGLRHSATLFSNTAGGQIDSFYVNENYRASADYDPTTGDHITKVKVTIPTKSDTEGAKTDSYTYDLHTMNSSVANYTLLRNYIYTLDIKVRGQSLEPVITVSVQPWNDVNIDGNIYGTYLTLNKSEIIFDEYGKVTIDFCTDAQAVYFDYSGFNNMSNLVGINGTMSEIMSDGIDDGISGLAPAGFEDGQILLDQQHCGSFGFHLMDLNDSDFDQVFPGFKQFQTFNYSGKVCMKAGNIVKCLTIPAIRTYDAHFIVGDSIFPYETYTNATVYEDNNVNSLPGWLEISENRLYKSTEMKTTYSNSTGTRLYLHLNENLTGFNRSGSVVVTTASGHEKKLRITQLPAIKVGRFGHTTYPNPPLEDSIFNTDLYTEQLYEYQTLPIYKALDNNLPNYNFVFRGWGTTSQQFDATNYNNGNFNYQASVYQAINYCAYKNRGTNTDGTIAVGSNDIKWFLPSQAQLLGMWISHTSYKNKPSNFENEELYWSATANKLYPNESQYVNFKYGNVGHYYKSQKYWVRCVRSGESSTNSMILTSESYPVIDFGNGMPSNSYTTDTKGNAGGDENSDNNKTVYRKLRVANDDFIWSAKWSIDTCSLYSEGGVSSGWRLPTQRELQAIWILQSEIKKAFTNTFHVLGDDYYWSATDASTASSNAWTIWGSITEPGSAGNAPNRTKTDPLSVRCVREETQ
jgi:hypothetical protein